MCIYVYALSTLFEGALDLRLFKVNLFLRVCKCLNGALNMNPKGLPRKESNVFLPKAYIKIWCKKRDFFFEKL